jgi:hypothetical protein
MPGLSPDQMRRALRGALTAKVSRRLPPTTGPNFTTTADAAGGRLERVVGRSRCAEKNTDSQSSLTV